MSETEIKPRSEARVKIISKFALMGCEADVYGTPDEPLFLATDIAEWIEHNDVSTMLRTVDEDEKARKTVPTPGGDQEMWFLTVDGLYEVLMQSCTPIAKKFKKAVKEILGNLSKNTSI